jgi:diguanylate cyclase (GGDEF)-like protein
MTTPDRFERLACNADVLLWQSRIRLSCALVVGLGELLFQRFGAAGGSVAVTLGATLGYLLVVGLLTLYVWTTRRAPSWVVACTVVADVFFVFGATFVTVPPYHHDRTLVLAFFVLHLTEFYFGRGFALGALAAVVLSHLALVAVQIGAGAPLRWADEAWSLGVFVLTASIFLHGYGTFRGRLKKLVSLFENAADGDFSQEYEVPADPRPDSITLVGRAYNQFRTQLATMVFTDPLSGCLNRLGFEQQLAREIARASRAGSDIALIAVDIDDFKRVNDTFGHLTGDAVIEETGALLRAEVRAGDSVARVGGDEFVILLPDTGLDGAVVLATRLRDMYAARTVGGGEGRLALSLSIGVTSGPAAAEGAAEELRARADEALYAAKRGGRNLVRVWGGAKLKAM